MLFLLVCSSNCKICPFFSWLKTGTGAQSPRSCTVAFGSATGKGGSCEASVATQGAVDPLVGPHRCQRGYSKTVLTVGVFSAISSDGWLDQNAKWACRNDEVASLNPIKS